MAIGNLIPGLSTQKRRSRAGFAAWTLLCMVMMATSARSGEPAQSQDAPAPPSPQIKVAPPTPIAEQKTELEGSNPWNPAWDVMIENAIPREMLSKDRASAVKALCPRFSTMTLANKRAFWAYLFQALAAAEAGLKPTADVRHTEPEVAVVDTVSKRMVRSEGLLQLTYMDATRYGCDFDWEQDKTLAEKDPAKTILQPKNNLLCGVKILENQIVTQKKPLLTASSYWVTLRPGTPSYLVFAKQMKNVPTVCREGMPPVETAKRRHAGGTPAEALALHAPSATAAN